MVGRPVVAERSIASARDAGDVTQTGGIDISRGCERPWAALRPSRYAELAITERVGDGGQILGPA
jgi:hypothetical protein